MKLWTSYPRTDGFTCRVSVPRTCPDIRTIEASPITQLSFDRVAGPAHVHLGYLPGEAGAPVRSPRHQLIETLRDYLGKKTPAHTVGCIIYIF